MGALHEGHLSLVREARRENDIVVVSVFVNPTQFGPREDYQKYPRTLARDRRLLREAKVDFLFSPAIKQMYPEGTKASVEVGRVAQILCGKFRPGHFRGVATVVAKLFSIIQPTRAYFGAKDYQQTIVIKKMVSDLSLAVTIRVLPTVREKDGLAMSSRNRYLKPADRARARALSQTLFWIRGEVRKGKRNLAKLRQEGLKKLRRSVDRVDYLEIVDPSTLKRVTKFRKKIAVLAACFVGKTRLIDNVIIQTSSS